jgi:hypothetical protein
MPNNRKDGGKRDYEVGYRRPPKGSQFKPGQSGNPKGRPKPPETFESLLQQELKARIKVVESGVPKRMSKEKGLVKSLVNGGLAGKLGHMLLIAQLLRQVGGEPGTSEKPLSPDAERLLAEFYGGQNKERRGARRSRKKRTRAKPSK